MSISDKISKDKGEQLKSVKSFQSDNRNFKLFMIFLTTFAFFSVGGGWLDLGAIDINWEEAGLYLLGDGTYQNPGFFAPYAPQDKAWDYFLYLLDTIAMAFLASFISVPFGFLIALFMSRNILDMLFFRYPKFRFMKPVIYYFAVFLANIMRSVNELVWALVFVAAIGLGPLSGILALGIHSGGVMAKLMAERLEDIDNEICWHNILDRSPMPHCIYYTVMPQIKPIFISTILYRFETDIRSATVVGIVGAGGIGMFLKNTLENFQTDQASLIMLMIIILIFTVDKLSAVLREHFTK